MLPLSSLSSDRLSSITMVASDVDDTITTSGSLHPCALEALYAMHEAGLTLVLVTGGSAGWGDVYMRQWPVDMVIAESGALALQRDGVVLLIQLEADEVAAGSQAGQRSSGTHR